MAERAVEPEVSAKSPKQLLQKDTTYPRGA